MLYIFHCTECHHEWQSVEAVSKCDWCGAEGYVLTENKEWDGFSELLEKMDEGEETVAPLQSPQSQKFINKKILNQFKD